MSVGSIVGGGVSEYCSCTGESVEESSDENWELNDGFFECFVCAVCGEGGFCVRRGDVVRSVCWSCLFDLVARLEALDAVAVFASCRAMGLVLIVVLLFT